MRSFPLFGALLFLALTSTLISELWAGEWAMWRGPHRNGISDETDWSDRWPEAGPKVCWRAQVGTGFSSVAVAGGMAYTLGHANEEDTLVGLDVDTGQPVWKYTYAASLDDRFFEGGPTSTPTIDGPNIYLLSRAGDIVSLRARDGEKNWSKNLPEELGIDVPGWGFAGSPVIVGEHLFLSVGQSGTALHKETGNVLWHSEGEAGYMTPLPIERPSGLSLIIASGKFYHEVEADTGKVKWRHRWLTNFGCNAADPIHDRGRIFISSGYNRGCALLEPNDEAVSVVWENKDLQNQWSSSLLIGGHLYGVDGNDTGERFLKCMEIETGKVRWSVEGFGSASLMAANDRLIVLSDEGELIIAPVSEKEFTPTSRAQVLTGKCWTVPVLANGRLYCRSASGELVCIELRESR